MLDDGHKSTLSWSETRVDVHVLLLIYNIINKVYTFQRGRRKAVQTKCIYRVTCVRVRVRVCW